MPLSTYLENRLLEHTLRITAWPQPTGLWVAMYTGEVSDADDDAALASKEVSGVGYARTSVTFQRDSDGLASNVTEVRFPTAGSNWGVITDVGILDGASGGNLLLYGPMTTRAVINNGDTFIFAAGDMVATLE